MAKPLSMDLRSRAMARLAEGWSVRAVAAALSVSPSSVVKWSQRLRATGRLEPGKMGGHVRPKIAGEHRAWLLQRTGQAATPVITSIRSKEPVISHFTIRGLVAELAERGLRVDYRTVWKFVHREGLSFKKNGAGGRTGPARRGPQAGPMEDASGQA
jgi:transposase